MLPMDDDPPPPSPLFGFPCRSANVSFSLARLDTAEASKATPWAAGLLALARHKVIFLSPFYFRSSRRIFGAKCQKIGRRRWRVAPWVWTSHKSSAPKPHHLVLTTYSPACLAHHHPIWMFTARAYPDMSRAANWASCALPSLVLRHEMPPGLPFCPVRR